MKRLFDITLSSLLLILLSPFLLCVSLLIRIFLGRGVIFSQKRAGLKGEIFEIYKFRTMREAFDKFGNPLPDKERMTKFGNFLRKTSIDELPQLVNILKGEMSIVGPRPFLAEWLTLYKGQQHRRHDVLPGVTGWAQVNGRNSISWQKKFALDVWYVQNRTFSLDLFILFRTVMVVIARKDINQKGEATVAQFTGKTDELEGFKKIS